LNGAPSPFLRGKGLLPGDHVVFGLLSLQS
jgi:hypothetical protein